RRRLLPRRHPNVADPRPPMFDHLHAPAKGRFHPLFELPLVGTVHPQMPQAREALLPGLEPEQHQLAPVSICLVCWMDDGLQEEALRIHQDMPLASLHLLAAVVATRPPFSVVLTDWLSRMAALGLTSRPARRRACSRKRVWMRSQVPSSRQSL